MSLPTAELPGLSGSKHRPRVHKTMVVSLVDDSRCGRTGSGESGLLGRHTTRSPTTSPAPSLANLPTPSRWSIAGFQLRSARKGVTERSREERSFKIKAHLHSETRIKEGSSPVSDIRISKRSKFLR